MIRNLKALGLALVAVFAMSAVVASGAQAEQFYHSSATPTTLSGTIGSTNIFHVPGAGTVECNTASFPGTVVGTTVSEIRVTPVYTGCVAFGFATTDIITTECHYLFTTPTTTGTTSHAPLHVECTGANKIKITPTFFGASVCTVEVGSQTPGGVVDFENKSSSAVPPVPESHVLVTSTATGISHTAGCGGSAAADGTYTGSVTVKGGANRVWVT
jgi:hypothetical protein